MHHGSDSAVEDSDAHWPLGYHGKGGIRIGGIDVKSTNQGIDATLDGDTGIVAPLLNGSHDTSLKSHDWPW